MIANLITASRLVLAAAFAATVAFLTAAGPSSGGGALGPAGLLLLALLAGAEELTDKLDGTFARRSGTVSVLGGLIDPLADSLARLTIYFALALAGWAPLAVPLVMTGRDLIVAYTRVVNALTGGTTSARVSGKCKAVVQGGGVFVLLLLAFLPGRGDEPGNWIPPARVAAGGVIIAVTLWSLTDYLRGAARGIRDLARGD